MDLSDILASSVHDIKNSLGMVMHSLDEMLADPANQIADHSKANLLQQQARRANNDLIQLLTLYKLESAQLTLNVQEHYLDEFFQELQAEHAGLTSAMGIDLQVDVAADLSGYFDDELVRSILGNAIGNAGRYTHSCILLSANEEDGYLVMRVEDDGDGYPDAALANVRELSSTGVFTRGRTQLGLFFADRFAKLHQAGERAGRISLSNGHRLTGGCFALWLP